MKGLLVPTAETSEITATCPEVKENKNKVFLHLALHSHAERAQHAFGELNWTKIELWGFKSLTRELWQQSSQRLGGREVCWAPSSLQLPEPRRCPPLGVETGFPHSGLWLGRELPQAPVQLALVVTGIYAHIVRGCSSGVPSRPAGQDGAGEEPVLRPESRLTPPLQGGPDPAREHAPPPPERPASVQLPQEGSPTVAHVHN